MSKPVEPRRLEHEGSPDLQRLIADLRADAPSAQAFQRMSRALDRSVDGPGLANSGRADRLAPPLAKIALVVVAASLALLALWDGAERISHEKPRSSAALAAPAAPAAPETASPARTQAVELREAAAVPAPPAPTAAQAAVTELTKVQPERQVQLRHAARIRTLRAPAPNPGLSAALDLADGEPASSPQSKSTGESVATAGDTARHAPAQTVSVAPSVAPRVAPSVAPSVAPRETVVSAPHAAERATRVTPVATLRPNPAPTTGDWDEATLLQRARRLAHERPEAALRLLDEHKQRFPQGMLAPEREVLAIEIFRAEGRSAEARDRLEAFRKRYRDSVYLERLGH